MKLLRVIVEGERDFYFFHNLFTHCLTDLLKPYYKNGKGLVYTQVDLDSYFVDSSQSLKVQIKYIKGKDKFDSIKQYLYDDCDNDVLYLALLFFDADNTGTDNGGVIARKQFLTKKVEEFALGNNGPKCGIDYFLIPNNKDDGEIETLMTAMASSKSSKFFTYCWKDFQNELTSNNYLILSDKSKIYDYIEASATNIPIKQTQGYNKNLSQDILWDWSVKELNPLVNFIREKIAFIMDK